MGSVFEAIHQETGQPVETRQLLWNLNGTPTKVRQEIFLASDEANGSTSRGERDREDHYMTVIRHEDAGVGLDLSTQGPGRMTPAEVRKLFESLEIVPD